MAKKTLVTVHKRLSNPGTYSGEVDGLMEVSTH